MNHRLCYLHSGGKSYGFLEVVGEKAALQHPPDHFVELGLEWRMSLESHGDGVGRVTLLQHLSL